MPFSPSIAGIDRRSFAMGFSVAILLGLVGWLAVTQLVPPMTDGEAALYDHCLATGGDKLSCDATLRIVRARRP